MPQHKQPDPSARARVRWAGSSSHGGARLPATVTASLGRGRPAVTVARGRSRKSRWRGITNVTPPTGLSLWLQARAAVGGTMVLQRTARRGAGTPRPRASLSASGTCRATHSGPLLLRPNCVPPTLARTVSVFWAVPLRLGLFRVTCKFCGLATGGARGRPRQPEPHQLLAPSLRVVD